MGLYTDIPTRAQIDALMTERDPACVAVYLPTDPASADAAPIALKDLTRQAVEQLKEAGTDKHVVDLVDSQLTDLVDDVPFWRFQARGLAVFVTPDHLSTYRLPTTLKPFAAVSDRFHIAPLLRSVTFPQTGYVLALAQGSVRLLEITEGVSPVPVEVPGMPTDVASAVGKATIKHRAPEGRVQGSEGQKTRMRQYARQIDAALHGVLPGNGVPLILAGTEPLLSIFREVCRYPDVVEQVVAGNPEGRSDGDLVADARKVLDEVNAAGLAAVRATFEERASQGRTATDLGDVARFATQGAVDTVLLDMDADVPGTVDDVGVVTYAEEDDAVAYGVVDEVARRVWLAGGRVLAVRAEDVPGGGGNGGDGDGGGGSGVAAVLRYAPTG